jgi:sugar-specific transcriptional regulator TrmB
MSLTTIGLTKTQACCYGILSQGRGQSAPELAKQVGVNRNTLYRMLQNLQEKGFIEKWHIIGPAKYRGVPLTHALVAYADYQRRQVKELIVLQQSRCD